MTFLSGRTEAEGKTLVVVCTNPRRDSDFPQLRRISSTNLKIRSSLESLLKSPFSAKPNLLGCPRIGLESIGHVIKGEPVLASGLRGDAIARHRDFEISHVRRTECRDATPHPQGTHRKRAPVREWIAAEMRNLAKPEERVNRRPDCL